MLFEQSRRLILSLALARCGLSLAQTSAPANPLLSGTIAADGEERPNAAEGYVEAYLPVLFPSSHASNLYQLQNGDILCVWFSGTWEGHSGVGIVISRLAPGSKRWSATSMIDRREGVSYQNPVLFQSPDGTLHLFHTVQDAGAGEAGAQVLQSGSTDNGHTWTQPTVLFSKPGAFVRHPALVLADNSWLLPLDFVTSKGIGAGSETNYSATEISKDHGKTWKECFMAGSMGKVQPTVVQLAPHRLLAYLRSRGSDFIYQSTSEDGCTWTPAVPTALPNNNASVQLFRLHDGHLVLAFDNSSSKAGTKTAVGLRKPLSVALSDNNGQTWPHVRDVETGRPGYGMAEQKPKTPGREEYSYPSIMQAADGHIYLSFTYRRQTIKVVRFDEDWIKKGDTTGEFHGSTRTAR